LEALDQVLGLDPKEMEQELAGMAIRVLRALLSALRLKSLLREDSWDLRRCGKQPQEQVPAQ